MQKQCKQCRQTFEISEEDVTFLDKVSPVFNGKKESIPPPTLCPDCRRQRRYTFRNERTLYLRKCDLTGRQIVSAYSPDKPFKVYQSDEWFSDKWDAKEYGRAFDFSRPFFDQFLDLKLAVPRMALVTSAQAEEYNCMYINFAGHSKNCYMTFDSDYNEDAMYTNVLKHSKTCADCSFVRKSERCYECVDCVDCYNLRYSNNCSNCSDSAFLNDCIGCKNCFFCSNIQRKEYCVYNKQYTKEEYKTIISGLTLGSYAQLQEIHKDALAFSLQHPHKNIHTLNVDDVTGDHIANAQRCYRCFDVGDAQDLRYCDSLFNAKDCMDTSSFGEGIELVYDCGTAGIQCYGLRFCFECVINDSDLLYCDECRSCSHCFGCSALRGAKYCILNKQYTQEEYEELVPKIIDHMRSGGEWGEFFPAKHSAFGYNETVASEYFPLPKGEVIKRGWKWHDETEKSESYLGPAIAIPDHINEVSDDMIKNILRCEVTGKPYKILLQELKFYRDMGLPIPRKCPDQRYKERMQLRNPRKLFDRECMKCRKAIQTTYAPGRSEIVYCEDCYLSSVY